MLRVLHVQIRRQPALALVRLAGFAPASPASKFSTFWEEVADAERKRLQASKQASRDRPRKQTTKRAEASQAPSADNFKHSEDEVELLLRDHTSSWSESSGIVTRSRPDVDDDALCRIREIQPENPGPQEIETATMPFVQSHLMAQLLSSPSAGAVLSLCASKKNAQSGAEEDTLAEFALALQLLGRLTAGSQRKQILKDRRLGNVLAVLGEAAGRLEPWALTSALRGISRLGEGGSGGSALGSCGLALVEASRARLGELTLEQAAVQLQSLCSSPTLLGSKAGAKLKTSLVEQLESGSKEIKPRVAAALVAPLVRLRAAGSLQLADALATQVTEGADELQVSELAAAASGFVALRVISQRLLERTEKSLQQNIHLCTPRAVVQFCAALIHRDSVSELESFKDFLMPAARSFILDFGPRDICTVAEAFTRVTAAEPEFLADLAHSLQPKVSKMGAHEVSVATTIFAPVAYAVPELLPAVCGRALTLADEFSPRQLAHTLRGLAVNSCSDTALLAALRTRATRLAQVIYGTNAVDMLMALSEAECLDRAVLDALLGSVSRNLLRISAQDCIAVLTSLARLPSELQSAVPSELPDNLLEAIRQRGYGPWRLELEAVVNLLESLHDLRLEDESLLELVCERLPAALTLAEYCSLQMLVRLIKCLVELPPRSRLHVRMHLHRRHKFQSALKVHLARHLARRLDLQSEVEVARAVAQLGFEDGTSQEWLDRLVGLAEPQLEDLPPAVSCELSWTLAELNWKIDWNRRLVQRFLAERYGAEASRPKAALEPGPLLRLAWAVAVLNERLPLPLLEELRQALGGALPSDWMGEGLKQLQAVVLHWQLDGQAQAESCPSALSDWLQLARECPRPELFAPQQPPRPERRQKRLASKEYAHERWLTVGLSQLRIPHQSGAVVACHRAAIVFRQQKQLIDVLGLADVSAPAGRTLGSAELRRRQFMQLGWAVHGVALRDLYEAVLGGSVRLFLTKLMSNFDPGAARRGSFRSSVLLDAMAETPRSSNRKRDEAKPRGTWEAEAEADVETEEDSERLRPLDPRIVLQVRTAKAAAAVFTHRRTAGQETEPPRPAT